MGTEVSKEEESQTKEGKQEVDLPITKSESQKKELEKDVEIVVEGLSVEKNVKSSPRSVSPRRRDKKLKLKIEAEPLPKLEGEVSGSLPDTRISYAEHNKLVRSQAKEAKEKKSLHQTRTEPSIPTQTKDDLNVDSPKSLRINTSQMVWPTLKPSGRERTTTFSGTRGWDVSKGTKRHENALKNLFGTYQKVASAEAVEIKCCNACSKSIETSAKYFCGDCQQVFCSNCCSKRKLDTDGNKIWVCSDCYWG